MAPSTPDDYEFKDSDELGSTYMLRSVDALGAIEALAVVVGGVLSGLQIIELAGNLKKKDLLDHFSAKFQVVVRHSSLRTAKRTSLEP